MKVTFFILILVGRLKNCHSVIGVILFPIVHLADCYKSQLLHTGEAFTTSQLHILRPECMVVGGAGSAGCLSRRTMCRIMLLYPAVEQRGVFVFTSKTINKWKKAGRW